MRIVKRALSLLLVLALLTGLSLTGVQADDASAKEITISSVEEFQALVKNCVLDTWSQGKTVRLTADIDLSGRSFSPIPTFGGTFLGGGHSISGLNLTADGSNMGLFRFVQRGAVVSDLHVSGRVVPGGSRSNVGGIAGSNEGTILGCSFQGTVQGESAVGGIAGSNGSGGEITRCSAAGSVTGKNGTGGIAGRSWGLLLECVNAAGVNIFDPGPAAGLDGLNVEGALSQLATPASDETSDRLPGSHTDTGGVVGYSAGEVRGCSNAGAVGYSHVGYNVGGVAGRQAGYMEGCTNSALVRGRKDVGGIIGQAEPDVELNVGEDTLSRLRRELSTLSGMIERTIGHADLSRGTISERLAAMLRDTDGARDSTETLLDHIADFTDENLNAVNTLRAAVTAALRDLDPAWDGLEGVAGAFSDLSDELEAALNEMQDGGPYGQAALDAAKDAVADLRLASADMEAAAGRLRDASGALRRAVTIQDQEAVSDALAEMSPALEQLGDALVTIGESLSVLLRARGGNGSGESDDPEEDPEEGPSAEEIKDAWDQLGPAISDAGGAVRTIAANVRIIGANIRVDRELVQEALSHTFDALGSLGTAAGAIVDAMDDLRSAFNDVGTLIGFLAAATGRLGSAAGFGSDLGEALKDVFDVLQRVSGHLAKDGAVEFTTLGQTAREAGNDLFAALSELSGNMEALRSETDAAGDALSVDVTAINRQLEVIFLLVVDLLDDTQNVPEPSDLIGDVSDEDIDNAHIGKAEDCVNTGDVEGDRNVGGVVGAMSVEYAADPEDDNTSFSYGSYYEIRAVLRGCVNQGEVTGRRDCVGGLVGRMDLGTVAESENYGGVTSTGGSYVGGVVGYSDAVVRESWAKCSVSGEDYVGGVAGWASRMTDCRAIAVIGAGTQCVGSVAGGAEIESGGVRGNLFVDMGAAGVDGISYTGIAEPISYQGLLALPGVPAGFTAFTLTLRADGETVARFSFRYGEDLSGLSLPAVPAREGFYGIWPEFDRSGMRSDLVLDAVYTPWVTLVASARREGKLPLVLAEGQFTADVSPEVRDSAIAPPEGGEGWDVWEISLPGAEKGAADSVPLRLLNRSGGKVQVLRYTGGGWEEVEARENGQYLLLTMTGPSAVFCIRPVTGFSPLVPGLLIASAGLCIILLVLRKRKAAKRKTSAPS